MMKNKNLLNSQKPANQNLVQKESASTPKMHKNFRIYPYIFANILIAFLAVSAIFGSSGELGAWGVNFSEFNLHAFGHIGYVYLLFLFYPAWILFKNPTLDFRKLELCISTLLGFCAALLIQSLLFEVGAFGNLVVKFLSGFIGNVGVWILSIGCLILSYLSASQRSLDSIFLLFQRAFFRIWQGVKSATKSAFENLKKLAHILKICTAKFWAWLKKNALKLKSLKEPSVAFLRAVFGAISKGVKTAHNKLQNTLEKKRAQAALQAQDLAMREQQITQNLAQNVAQENLDSENASSENVSQGAQDSQNLRNCENLNSAHSQSTEEFKEVILDSQRTPIFSEQISESNAFSESKTATNMPNSENLNSQNALNSENLQTTPQPAFKERAIGNEPTFDVNQSYQQYKKLYGNELRDMPTPLHKEPTPKPDFHEVHLPPMPSKPHSQSVPNSQNAQNASEKSTYSGHLKPVANLNQPHLQNANSQNLNSHIGADLQILDSQLDIQAIIANSNQPQLELARNKAQFYDKARRQTFFAQSIQSTQNTQKDEPINEIAQTPQTATQATPKEQKREQEIAPEINAPTQNAQTAPQSAQTPQSQSISESDSTLAQSNAVQNMPLAHSAHSEVRKLAEKLVMQMQNSESAKSSLGARNSDYKSSDEIEHLNLDIKEISVQITEISESKENEPKDEPNMIEAQILSNSQTEQISEPESDQLSEQNAPNEQIQNLDSQNAQDSAKPEHITEIKENTKLLQDLDFEKPDFGKPHASLNFKLPPSSLLAQPPIQDEDIDELEIDQKIERLLGKLRTFKIYGDVVRTYSGPIVTTFEFRPAPNVKVSSILNLENDLALELSAKSIRIQAPVPGKDVVGIEIPNNNVQTIFLRELLESDLFKSSTSKLTIVLGKDIVGNPFVQDLRKLPHLLIAGTTGSGKSVGLNAIILSLLYKSSPDDLKLLMIDPKRVEFSMYSDIPHLITPIITDPKKAINALLNACKEMDRRYDKMKDMRTKEIDSYNAKAREEGEEVMPYFVIIVDEMADLMMTAGKEAEWPLNRIAQMGRACGMHLVIATQRPSTNVITGVLKSNLPSRISYKVGSSIDSKVILDNTGAEKLLGRGDMLFRISDSTIRLHAPFSSEGEIERVVEFVKSQREPNYDNSYLADERESVLSGEDDGAQGDILEQIKQFMRESGNTSISSVQRRFNIGFNKAAAYIDQLEKDGFLSKPNTRGARQIIG